MGANQRATPPQYELARLIDAGELRPAIVVAVSEDGLAVVPVTAEVAMAAEWDVVLPTQLLGYDAVADQWRTLRATLLDAVSAGLEAA